MLWLQICISVHLILLRSTEKTGHSTEGHLAKENNFWRYSKYLYRQQYAKNRNIEFLL